MHAWDLAFLRSLACSIFDVDKQGICFFSSTFMLRPRIITIVWPLNIG